MATTAEKAYHVALQTARLRRDRAEEGQRSQADNQKTLGSRAEDLARNVAAQGTKLALTATGAGAPVAAVAGRVVGNRWVFRLIIVGGVLSIVGTVLLVITFIASLGVLASQIFS